MVCDLRMDRKRGGTEQCIYCQYAALCSLRLDLRTGYESPIETRPVYSHGGEIGHPCYVQHGEIEAFSIFCFRSHENWVANIFYFYPYLGKWSNLTNIFQRGWNHQLEIIVFFSCFFLPPLGSSGFFSLETWASYRLLFGMPKKLGFATRYNRKHSSDVFLRWILYIHSYSCFYIHTWNSNDPSFGV